MRKQAVFLGVLLMSGLLSIKDSTADGPPPPKSADVWLWTGNSQACQQSSEDCEWSEEGNWTFDGILYPIYGYPQEPEDKAIVEFENGEDLINVLLTEDIEINSITVRGSSQAGSNADNAFTISVEEEEEFSLEAGVITFRAPSSDDTLSITVNFGATLRTVD